MQPTKAHGINDGQDVLVLDIHIEHALAIHHHAFELAADDDRGKNFVFGRVNDGHASRLAIGRKDATGKGAIDSRNFY